MTIITVQTDSLISRRHCSKISDVRLTDEIDADRATLELDTYCEDFDGRDVWVVCALTTVSSGLVSVL